MKKQSKGFTLIELTVTIVIFGILVVMSLFSYRKFVKEAMISEGKMLVSSIAKIQKLYHAESEDYHAISATSYSTVPEIDARFNKYFQTFSVDVPGNMTDALFTVTTSSQLSVLCCVEVIMHVFENKPSILIVNTGTTSTTTTDTTTDTGSSGDTTTDTGSGSDQTNNGNNGNSNNGNNGNGNGNNGNNGNGNNGNTADGDDNNNGGGQEKNGNNGKK